MSAPEMYFVVVVTLLLPSAYLARHILASDDSITCKDIQCELGQPVSECPPWNYCDSQKRYCSPCGRCKDARDYGLPSHPNCRDPFYCTDLYNAKTKKDVCPPFRIAEGFQCSGACSPCGGVDGSYLGTTCTVECDDEDGAIFGCILVNDHVQWNFTTQPPIWIVYADPLPDITAPSTPTPNGGTGESTVSPNSTHLGFSLETIAGIVVGGVLALVVIIVALFVYMKREKEGASPPTTPNSPSLGNSEEDVALVPPQTDPIPVVEIRHREAIEHDEHAVGNETSSSSEEWQSSARRTFRIPDENSTDGFSIHDPGSTQEEPEIAQPYYWGSPKLGLRCEEGIQRGPSLISLRSERLDYLGLFVHKAGRFNNHDSMACDETMRKHL